MRCGPIDCGAEVLALAGDAELIARPSTRGTPLPVVDHDHGETFTAEPFSERRQSARLHCAHSVSHDDGWVWTWPGGLVEPRVQFRAAERRDPHGRARRRSRPV